MLIGSKLPPTHVDKTYFNMGRSAFAFLVSEIIKPKKVYLPAFTCWSLVSTMQLRFPEIKLEFYPVKKDLSCIYPKKIKKGELLVFIHFFGHENKTPLPYSEGVILEDISHAIASKINHKGDYVFGSLRKIIKVGDGGFVNKYFNPVYEQSKKLETWLRYEAIDWRDMREAENMVDRNWEITDISSQSLEIFLTTNYDLLQHKRFNNEKYLYDNIKVGRPLLKYKNNEAPLVHNRILKSKKDRDSLRKFLAKKGIFTSIHWPTHNLVKNNKKIDVSDILWLESHIISIPVSQEYNLNDMEYVVKSINKWKK